MTNNILSPTQLSHHPNVDNSREFLSSLEASGNSSPEQAHSDLKVEKGVRKIAQTPLIWVT